MISRYERQKEMAERLQTEARQAKQREDQTRMRLFLAQQVEEKKKREEEEKSNLGQ